MELFWIYLYVFVLGTVIGSFLNVCIIRYQNGEPIARGRSHCMSCHHQLAWYDLVPVFSWLFLKGRCRYCGKPISARYPLVEALTGILYVLVLNRFGFTWDTLIYFVLVSVCVYAGFVDYDSMIIPDRTHILFVICGVLLLLLHPGLMKDRLIGAAVVSLPMLAVAYFTKGMGYGDVKLLAAAGFVLGWKSILFVLALGSVLASIVALSQMKRKNLTGKSEMPLGPYLVIAIVFVLLYGDPIIQWYVTSFFH